MTWTRTRSRLDLDRQAKLSSFGQARRQETSALHRAPGAPRPPGGRRQARSGSRLELYPGVHWSPGGRRSSPLQSPYVDGKGIDDSTVAGHDDSNELLAASADGSAARHDRPERVVDLIRKKLDLSDSRPREIHRCTWPMSSVANLAPFPPAEADACSSQRSMRGLRQPETRPGRPSTMPTRCLRRSSRRRLPG